MQRRIPAVFVRGGTSRALVFHHRDLPGDRRGVEPHLSRRARKPRPERPAARRSGRRHLVALEGRGGGAGHPRGRRRRLHLRPGRGDARGRRLPGELRQHLVGDRALRHRRGARPGPGARHRRAHPQHQHPEADPRPRARGGRPGRGPRGLRARRRSGHRRADRARLRRPGRRRARDGSSPPATPRTPSRSSGLGTITASLVDATNPMVFVRAKDLGLDGTERPEDLDGRPGLPARLEAIRAAAAVLMGLARTPEEAGRTSAAVPKIAILAPPAGYRTLAGDAGGAARRRPRRPHRVDGQGAPRLRADRGDVPGRGGPHPGHRRPRGRRAAGAAGDVRIGHPSGVLPVAAAVRPGPDGSARGADGHGLPHRAPADGGLRPRPVTHYRGGHSWQRPDASS